jgi:uncharacterized protein
MAFRREDYAMTGLEKIQKDIVEAMKSKDKLRLDVLRGMKTAIKNKEIERMRQLEEGELLQVLLTLVKQRKDSIDQFSKGGRSDLVERETAELEILEGYLPPAVGEQEIQEVVAQAISELKGTSTKDIGKVMKLVMEKFSGRVVDGKLVNQLVRTQLEN